MFAGVEWPQLIKVCNDLLENMNRGGGGGGGSGLSSQNTVPRICESMRQWQRSTSSAKKKNLSRHFLPTKKGAYAGWLMLTNMGDRPSGKGGFYAHLLHAALYARP